MLTFKFKPYYYIEVNKNKDMWYIKDIDECIVEICYSIKAARLCLEKYKVSCKYDIIDEN